MKVFISVDIEGCAGVVNSFHTSRVGDDYATGRRIMTGEANAAIAGALEAGATEVVVNDSHGSMTNLLPEELHPKAQLISGCLKKLSMMEGIDESFDAALYVGYHTAAGVAGSISHTYNGQIYAVRLNGQPCGEFDINAAVAGQFGVPSVLLTGDDRICAFTKKRYPQVQTAQVKEYRSRNASKNLHPEVACERIKEATRKALGERERIDPVRVEKGVMELELPDENATTFCSLIPTIEQVGDRTVRFTAPTAVELYQRLILCAQLLRGLKLPTFNPGV